MEDWKLVALTSGLSLFSSVIVAIITSIVTARATQKNDDRHKIQEKRTELYYNLQNRIESLVYDREQVYTIKYRNSLLKYRPQVALWASEKVRKKYDEFYDYINGIFEAYLEFMQDSFPDDMISNYKEEHLPDLDKIKTFRRDLYRIMQEDMGSNK